MFITAESNVTILLNNVPREEIQVTKTMKDGYDRYKEVKGFIRKETPVHFLVDAHV